MPAGPRMASRHADDAARHGDEGPGVWVLQRRCSLTPRQFGLCFVALAAVALLVASAFWVVGAPFVALFTGIELIALGAAFGWHAFHAADGERLRVDGGLLWVEQCRGLSLQVTALDLAHMRVDDTVAGVLELRSPGRCVRVGGALDAARRRQVAAALRRLALN